MAERAFSRKGMSGWDAQISDSTLRGKAERNSWQDRYIASDLAVVLIASRNPLNIGAAARAMANFGFADLRLVNPYDLAFREAVSAVGGAHVLKSARLFASAAEAVCDCELVVGTTAAQRRELKQPIERLDAGMPKVRQFGGRVALLFGSEKFGLSNEDLSLCHSLVCIPTAPDTPSMNLGQAVAVCLYELIRSEETLIQNAAAISKTAWQDAAIEGVEAEQLTKMLIEVLRESGYTNRITAVSTEQKIRRWIRRLRLTRRDSPLLLGFLRQILWKVRER